MKRATPVGIAVSVAVVLLAMGCATTDYTQSVPPQPLSQQSIDTLTASWPATPREVAATIIVKYGLPHEATASMLVWHDSGPWKRTILYRDEIPHDFPKPHTDLLEQFVNYRVPVDRFDDLAAYDGSVIVERTKGEISARCDKEDMNFLALNLADDIVAGRRTVEDARQFYARTAMAAMRGETSPYVQGLRFPDDQLRTADRDVPAGSMLSGSPNQSTLLLIAGASLASWPPRRRHANGRASTMRSPFSFQTRTWTPSTWCSPSGK